MTTHDPTESLAAWLQGEIERREARVAEIDAEEPHGGPGDEERDALVAAIEAYTDALQKIRGGEG